MAFVNDGTIHLGYNDCPWTFSDNAADVYTFTADPIRRPLHRFRAEAQIAAREIRNKFDDMPLYVLYSGGIDSEVVLEAFRLAKIPVTAVCVRFEDGLNDHDLTYARQYFDKTNWEQTNKIQMIDVNVRDWLRSQECEDMARTVQTPELGYTHLFKSILENLGDGIPIIGQEEPLVWRTDYPDRPSEWIFHSHERHYSLHKFFLAYDIVGIPSFFQWSTELHNSFMYNDHWIGLFNNLYAPQIWSTDHLKYGFYFKEFGLVTRTKYTGFEQMLDEILERNKDWMNSLPLTWQRSRNINVNQWFKDCNVRGIYGSQTS